MLMSDGNSSILNLTFDQTHLSCSVRSLLSLSAEGDQANFPIPMFTTLMSPVFLMVPGKNLKIVGRNLIR